MSRIRDIAQLGYYDDDIIRLIAPVVTNCLLWCKLKISFIVSTRIHHVNS